MKKILLGTSAVALAGATATSANAATWDLDWGGYFEAGIGYANVDAGAGTDFDGVDVITDEEIIFTPSITLDNGLTFGVDIQLEGKSGGDQIDESFAFVKGSFGQVLIGSENSAGYKMMYGAPDVTWINVNSGSLSAFIPTGQPGLFRAVGGSSFIEVDGGTPGGQTNNDAERITYFTPRFAGFQVGVSYARDGNQDSSGAVDVDGTGALHNIFDIGANYVNSFGNFDVAVAGRYGRGSRDFAVGDLDPAVWAVGLNLGFAGVTIGGSYADMNDDSTTPGEFFDLGISYETGPWGFSATYANGTVDVPTDEHNQQSYLLGATYKLGPGVKAGVWGAYVDYDAPFGSANDVDGFTVGTGFKLNF